MVMSRIAVCNSTSKSIGNNLSVITGEKSTTSTSMDKLPRTSKSIHKLLIKIPENLETTSTMSLCIYKVPPSLRHINPSTYTPQVISIGPIHYGKKSLHNMQIQKLRYFNEFCKRRITTVRLEDQQRIENEFATDLLNQIDVDEIRYCYEYGSYDEMESNEFVNLILLDSVFIIELLLRSIRFSEHLSDFIMGKPWLRTAVQNDLILLENQIPFFILEKIYNFAKKTIDGSPCSYPPFLELTCIYFHNFKPRHVSMYNPEMILHFTDLVRHLWACEHPEMWPGTIDSVYSITKLNQAGLKLKAVQGKGALNINYSEGILELPTIEVDYSTESMVRNLMALEQCHYPDETYICNYIRLLNLLINRAEDADLLIEKKIIANRFRDGHAVADFFNDLCNQIVEVKSCYSVLGMKLNGYYESSEYLTKAPICCQSYTMDILRKVYFADIWRGTGTVAAVVLLLLTLVQTVASVLQLYH